MEAKPVSRYTAAARFNHWITAVSLILLALSGLALFHPSLFFLTGLFGGGAVEAAVALERLERVDVIVVQGSDRNIKITKPTDLELAELFLAEERAEGES